MMKPDDMIIKDGYVCIKEELFWKMVEAQTKMMGPLLKMMGENIQRAVRGFIIPTPKMPTIQFQK